MVSVGKNRAHPLLVDIGNSREQRNENPVCFLDNFWIFRRGLGSPIPLTGFFSGCPQVRNDFAELFQRCLQIFHNLGGDDVGGWEIGGVFEGLVFEPEDVEVDLVAFDVSLGDG